MKWLCAFLVGCVACQPAPDPDPEDETASATSQAIVDGTPQSVGLLGLLNDASTTVALLDDDVGLDRRAAQNLVAHRDGSSGIEDDDRFDSIEEVDAVPYVGPSAFEKLLAYASAHGYVPQGDELLGVYDGVSFTVDEATATLAVANEEDATALDGPIGLDVRAVDAIVAARPIESVLALSELYFVGESALRKLKVHAVGTPSGQLVADKLEPAVDGLYHTSESDYPFEVVFVAGAGSTAITESNIKDRIASIYMQRPDEPTLAERDVEVTSLTSFFDRYTVLQDYWEPSQHELAPRFEALKDILASDLLDAHVYRIGSRYSSESPLSGAIDVYIVGRSSDGHLVGVRTISVET